MNTPTALDQHWAHQRLVWKTCLTPIHVLGILASIYRISRRYKTRQSGLDDHAATLALILDLIYFPTLWLRNGASAREVSTAGLSAAAAANGGLYGDDLPADIEGRIAQVVIDWLSLIVYPILTWTAKATIALTISRLIPASHCTHKASVAMACLSFFIGLGIVIQCCVYCVAIDKNWSNVPPYKCKVTIAAASLRFGSEVAVDIILVIIPFVTFFFRLPFHCPRLAPRYRSPAANDLSDSDPPVSVPVRIRLRLPLVTRRLIQVCFLASLLTTSTAIITLTLLLRMERSNSNAILSRIAYTGFVLSHLNGSMSLLSCNLLIVITSLYRLLRTPSGTIEIGKSPVIPNLPTNQGASGLEHSGATINDPSETGRSERAMAEGNMLSSSSGTGDAGSHPRTSPPSTATTSSIELTELFASDFSIA